ncbi:MAG: hypothetical protein MJ169_00605 [Treponema sp.]|nr:hypothetical protein [Treponema sp.]
MAAYPDQLDFAQKRVDKIMKARMQYVVLANNLLDVMEKEPENAQKKLEIISRLESVEKHPTQEQLSFIRQAKIAAQFTYYRARFRRIMDEAADSTTKKEYSSAVAQIQKGFDMYRDEFYEENPSSVTTSVTAGVNQINNLCREYTQSQDRLKSAYNDLLKAIRAEDYKDSVNAKRRFDTEMANLARIRNQTYDAADSLRNTFVSLQKKNPELTEASYLPFIFRFTFGLESNPDSGITGAMDNQFRSYLENLKPEVYRVISKTAYTQINASNIRTAATAPDKDKLSKAADFAGLGKDLNSMHAMLKTTQQKAVSYPDFDRSMDYLVTLCDGMKDTYSGLEQYRTTAKALEEVVRPENPVEGIRSSDSYASRMIEFSKAFDQTAFDADDRLKKQWYLSYGKELSLSSGKEKDSYNSQSILEFKNLTENYYSLNKLLYDTCIGQSQVQWKNTATYFAVAAAEIAEHYNKEYAYAKQVLDDKDPAGAISYVQTIEKDMVQDTKTLTECRDILVNNTVYKNAFNQEERSVVNSVNSITQLKSSGTNIITTANERIILAKRAQNEADLRLSQAQNEFRAQRYAQARDYINQARTKYNESLEYQDSQELRESSDSRLASLSEQITNAENQLVVAEVRRLKTQAKNEYYNGNFESSENLLNRAKSRWADTNVEEDEEIKNLLVLVETALSMKTGRVIPPTAPLYPEMSQILSIAHQYFDEGEKLIKQGKRSEGIAILNSAKKKLQELQLVYPLNQEASILTLKIDQLIDEKAFNEMFERRVNNAKNSYKVASQQQQAYTDLLDLYEINPSYPGLKKLINQIEIEIGVRQKPVDNTAIVRSGELTRQAQSIVNAAGRNETQLRQAISLLDQAIALNPNNDQAQLLKDRAQVAMGGKSTVVLTAANEARYQQAINMLQKNDIVGAYAVVEQLLQQAECRRSAKILALQKKIRALL